MVSGSAAVLENSGFSSCVLLYYRDDGRWRPDRGWIGVETPYFLCAIVQLLSQKALGWVSAHV